MSSLQRLIFEDSEGINSFNGQGKLDPASDTKPEKSLDSSLQLWRLFRSSRDTIDDLRG